MRGMAKLGKQVQEKEHNLWHGWNWENRKLCNIC